MRWLAPAGAGSLWPQQPLPPPTFQRWSWGVGVEGAPDWPNSDLEAWMPPGEVSWAAPALPRGGAQPSSGPRCSLHPGASRRRAPSLPHSAGPAPGGFAGQAAEGCSRQRASVGTLLVHFLHRPPPRSFCLSGGGGGWLATLAPLLLWLGASSLPSSPPEGMHRPVTSPRPGLRTPHLQPALEGLSARGALRAEWDPYLPARGLPYSWGFVI